MILSSTSISVDTLYDGIDLRVSPEQAGSRFDHFLVLTVPEVSRGILIQSIRQGLLLVDGNRKKTAIGLNMGKESAVRSFSRPLPN